MQRAVDLPTGTNPGWELGEHRLDGEDLRTVPERCVFIVVGNRSISSYVWQILASSFYSP